jgi:S-DNA-T family DNA segregation ATPase FtsK/SpoIIIE
VNRLGSSVHDGGPVQLHIAKVRVPLTAVVGAWLLRRTGAGLLWLTRHPMALAAAAVAVVLWRSTGARLLAVAVGVVLTVGLVVWCWQWPASFSSTVTCRARGWWRGTCVYRYHWQPAVVTTGLAVVHEGTEHLPRLLGVRSTGCADLVGVRMLPGHSVEDWAGVAARLAQTFGVMDCRVRTVPGRPHELMLWFLVADPLAEPVPPFPALAQGADVNLAALPVAVGEDGLTWRLRLVHTHLLVVGATGSGKGSVIWSVLAAVAPAIRDGLVRVVALDPKGGMELALGRPLFARFVHGDPRTALRTRRSSPTPWRTRSR